jgi:hypothetical protein
MQGNHKIKRWLFNYYATVSIVVFMVALGLFIDKQLCWKQFTAIAAAAFLVAFAVQKQRLGETELSRELFDKFNERYDEMNDDLNEIWNQPEDKPLSDDEKRRLFKYFNLCGEEYLYYQLGYIWPEVWAAWKSGMTFFRKKSRIKDFWDKELGNNQSYYGLSFDE